MRVRLLVEIEMSLPDSIWVSECEELALRVIKDSLSQVDDVYQVSVIDKPRWWAMERHS